MQAVDDVAALFLVEHQVGVAQHAEMVRRIDHFDAQLGGQFRDVLRSASQKLNNTQPFRIGDGF